MHALRTTVSGIMPLTVAFLLLLACLPARGLARTWYVPSVAGTIQAGVDSASAGDTVLVACGTYAEDPITLKDGITLISETGQADCVTLDGGDAHQIMLGNSLTAGVTVQGFTFYRGRADSFIAGILDGGGIDMAWSVLNLVNCDFDSCYASGWGGGVFSDGGSVTASGCDFTGNRGIGSALMVMGGKAHLSDCQFIGNWGGGAIWCTGDSLIAETCYFSANDGEQQGGIHLGSQVSVLTGSDFHANSAERGGGIYCYGDTLILSGCHFSDNVSTIEGGGIYCSTSYANLADCEFTADSSSFGGAIYCPGGVLDLTRCGFTSNWATRGGGICFEGSGLANMAACHFSANTASLAGGLSCDDSFRIGSMTGCTFSNNTSTGNAGAIYYNPLGTTPAVWDSCGFADNIAAQNGGGIYFGPDTDASVTMLDFDFTGNSAWRVGGAMYNESEMAEADVHYSWFSGNTADSAGGAVGSLGEFGPGFTWCTFTDNTGGAGGGCVFLDHGYASFSSCHFYINSAGLAGDGGVAKAINASYAGFTSCVLDNNSAGNRGGAIYADSSSVVVSGSTLYGNSSVNQGGGIYCNNSSSNLDHTIISASAQGEAFHCSGLGSQSISCTDIYGNPGGDWVGCIADLVDSNDNMWADPLFCNPGAYDYHLLPFSPCIIGACGQVGALGPGADCAPSIYPEILSITDVGNDQGHRVRIKWSRSIYDSWGTGNPITYYSIYRRQDANLALRRRRPDMALDDGGPGGVLMAAGWDFVAQVPARIDSFYQFVVETLCDSTDQGICWSVFFISAETADPAEFYDSAPDSGYSVDNLAPAPPPALTMTSPDELAWEHVPDEDFDYYSVYGSDLPDLDETSTLIGYTIDVVKDISGHVHAYYHVTATDFSGNEGDESSVNNTFAGVPSREDIPTSFALKQNKPNPFDTGTVIGFDVPQARRISLTVFDAAGRMVERLTNSEYEPGRHAVVWDGTDTRGTKVASGFYFVRMRAGDFEAMKKVILLR